MKNRSPKVILIGPCGGGGVPQNGASAKNYHLLKFLENLDLNLVVVDTEHWKKNPMVLLKLLFVILMNPRGKFIVAANSMSSYRIIQIISFFSKQSSIIYWIIGGNIANWIRDGKVKLSVYKAVDYFLAEGKRMKKAFMELGFDNAIYVPNFKCIDYIPKLKMPDNKFTRFVFLSRIIPDKGCDKIIEAVKILNQEFDNKSFCVDFFGPIEKEYEYCFMNAISQLTNVHYQGFLDLRHLENYDILAHYDVMLFPTYWQGEGFPGVIIDAFIAGLPVIASDWSLNAEIIDDGKTGLLLKDNTIQSLVDTMRRVMSNHSLLALMKNCCQREARNYDINNVISHDLLNIIGIKE